MDNPETMATLGKQVEDIQIKNTTQKTKMMNNTDPTNKPGMNTGARKW